MKSCTSQREPSAPSLDIITRAPAQQRGAQGRASWRGRSSAAASSARTRSSQPPGCGGGGGLRLPPTPPAPTTPPSKTSPQKSTRPAQPSPPRLVISAWSYAGATSTMSAPTNCRPCRPRSRPSISRELMPAISGVPVPGACAGSRLSMSMLRYTGPSPTRSRTRATTPSTPWVVNSSAWMMQNPSSASRAKSARLYSGPRMPMCTERSDRKSPSSAARRKGVPCVCGAPK